MARFGSLWCAYRTRSPFDTVSPLAGGVGSTAGRSVLEELGGVIARIR